MASGGYVPATRHPWPCLLFVLPLVAAYEGGVVMLGGAHPETLRNGADNWLRCGLTAVGVQYFWVPPAVLLLVFVAWAWGRWDDRPKDLLGVMTGMAIESVTFALGLWGLSRGLAPLLQRCGIALAVAAEGEPALRQVVTYLGAGIYEEALFRLVLFTLLVKLLRYLEVGEPLAALLAGLASATLFAVAHHIGPYGQPYSNYLFLFRLAAGLYFALLYQTRGFGIAVGAHACYNVMISVGAA
jgi:membrane protease YdiL (CAAX protease family)